MSDEYFKKRNRFDPVAMMNDTLKLGEEWAENKTAYDSLKDTEATLKSKIFEELKNNGHNVFECRAIRICFANKNKQSYSSSFCRRETI